MMKKLFFSVVYLLLIMPFYGYGMGKDNESDWNRLISEGSNYIVRATNTVVVDGRKFQHFASLNKQKATDEMKKWFSDFVAYSIPTNDMVRYADMLRVKTMLLYLTAWRMDSKKSWDELAKFLADVKSKKLPKSSERRDKLREKFRLKKGSIDIGSFVSNCTKKVVIKVH